MVEALADGVVEDRETQQRYLQTAQYNIRNLSQLINDLFDLAQYDAGRLTLDRHVCSAADLVSTTIERFSGLAARNQIMLAGAVEEEADAVHVDAQQIERVLGNLVVNALRHTPVGGQVSIRAGAVSGEACVSRWPIRATASARRISPFIFDQFYRGEKSRSRETGGSGLGLAIARRIVEAHGGQIGVDNERAGGARFFFTVPRGVSRVREGEGVRGSGVTARVRGDCRGC